MTVSRLIATTTLLAAAWFALAALALTANLPPPALWHVAVLALAGWLLTPRVAPEPAAPPAEAPKPEPEPERCDCDDCRAARGEKVPSLVSRMPELMRRAATFQRDQGAGVMVLAGAGDSDPGWIPLHRIDRPAAAGDPPGLRQLREALARVRQTGARWDGGTLIAVVGGGSVALYVVGRAGDQQPGVQEVLTA